MSNFQIKNQKGLSLYLAVIICGVLLGFATVSSKVVMRNMDFAITGENSNRAFFAADAGFECAIYWDSVQDTSKFDPGMPGSPITCAGTSISTGNTISGTTTATAQIGGSSVSKFGFILGTSQSDSCAIVIVNKTGATTKISSFGYNTCDVSDPRRVERGVEVSY